MKLQINPKVRDAMASSIPVIALETTVITHGMEFPDNIETAIAMEAAISNAGACPATLGVVDGAITVGLSESQIEAFAKSPRSSIAKCSRRDLPTIVGARKSGSLTVAGTLMVANAANIDIVATGGIGGVHRGRPFDVSADLFELGNTPVTVVCAGAKSILDLELTLESLETFGVPVVGVGCENLPAFYARDSGLALPASTANSAEAADVYRAWRKMSLRNGMVFAVPVPAEHAVAADEIEAIIKQAVAEAERQNISGNRITPYLLQRIVQLTDGKSLQANKALLVNNALTAAEIVMAS